MSDYNYAVLRLMTAPNFLLAYYNVLQSLNFDSEEQTQIADLDLQITPELLDQFFSFLEKHNISIKFISGPWNTEKFAGLLGYASSISTARIRFSSVLGSETIYSVASTNAFIPILLDSVALWNTFPDSNRESPLGLVAAKEIYFGVGGTVRQFIEDAEKKGGNLEIVRRIASGQSSGVARVIIKTTLK